MTRLSVNVNKIATLRNARGGQKPNVVEAAKRIQAFGADGITVHPRPDARHITYQDVHDLRDVVQTEFNVEGYPSDDFVKLVCDAKPAQVTLVPDPPDVLTSNAGWTVTDHADLLKNVLAVFKAEGIRTSLFIETDEAQIHAAAAVGAERIELYTESFAVQHAAIGKAATSGVQCQSLVSPNAAHFEAQGSQSWPTERASRNASKQRTTLHHESVRLDFATKSPIRMDETLAH